MTANTSCAFTVLPVFLIIFFRIPFCGAGTSSITLSVSRSTMFSSRVTESPSFLCQVETVASAMDSGSCGTLISIVMTFSFSLAQLPLDLSVLFHVPHNIPLLVMQMKDGQHSLKFAPYSTIHRWNSASYSKRLDFA